MFANIFGKYLVDKGVISNEQLQIVKEEQAKTRVKLGLIAVSEKMITEKQADEINRKQAVMDKRFGDIAVEIGYLTNEQVSRLLSLQGNPYMLFVQTITDKQIIDLATCEKALSDMKAEKGYSIDDIEAIKSGDIDRIVPIFLQDVLSNDAKDLIMLAVRTLNRLITTDICIIGCENSKKYSAKDAGVAYQTMSGDLPCATLLGGSNEGKLVIANTFAGEEFEQVDLDALDSIGEFINIVNGLFATSLSEKNIHVELMPPTYGEFRNEIDTQNAGDVYILNLLLQNKNVALAVTVGDMFC